MVLQQTVPAIVALYGHMVLLDPSTATTPRHADLLRRLGRGGESRAAYDRAIGLAGNPAERAYLNRRRDQLAG